MTDIIKAQYYRGMRPKKEIISVEYRDGRSWSGFAEAILPELQGWIEQGNNILPENPKGYPNHIRPSYQEHELCFQPSAEAKIWRYMSFEQLVSLLYSLYQSGRCGL